MLEPFTHGQPPTRYPIARIAADANSRWVRNSLAGLDGAERTVRTTSGQELPYDALLLALGGQERTPNSDVVVFTDHTS